MKQLTCDLCGSTNLVKDGGVFVCQNCGCKYTVEEARRMMMGGADDRVGAIDVTNTVEVSRSSEIDNILKNADATYADGNKKEAFDLYSQALSINPDNPHAILYRALSSAWQSSVASCKILELNNAAGRAFALMHQQSGDSAEYFDFCNKGLIESVLVINAINDMYRNYYNRAKPRNFTITGAIATAGISMDVKNTMQTGIKTCCSVSTSVINSALKDVKSYRESSESFWNNVEIIIKNEKIFCINAGISVLPETTALERRIEWEKVKAFKEIEERKREMREKYWADHTSEKEDYDTKETAMLSVESELKKARSENKRLLLEKDRAVYELGKLGVFKRKETKALQDQINNTNKLLDSNKYSIERLERELQKRKGEVDRILEKVDKELGVI